MSFMTPTPFTPLYKRSNYVEKAPLPATFQEFSVPSTHDGSLRKPYRSQQIGTEMSASWRSGNLVAEDTPKVPHQLPLIVHYLRWPRIALERHEFALPCRTQFQRLKSHVRTSILGYPRILLT